MMQMSANYKYSELTEKIIKAFYHVHNTLGYGFAEKVYENALVIELKKMGFAVRQQAPISVYYEQQLIGEYYADVIVEDKVILELKAARSMLEEHEAQLLNYLKASIYEVGLLLNFGTSAEQKRKAFDNARKGNLHWIQP